MYFFSSISIQEEFDVRHAFESMSFEELVRFLRQVEKSGVAQQILWSFLLFEEDGHVFPGTLMSLGKVLVPALHELEGTDKIDGNTDHVTKKTILLSFLICPQGCCCCELRV